MSKKYSLTQVLGVLFIFASIMPLLSFVVSIGYSNPFLSFPSSLSYYSVFSLCSPFVMFILGWGLADKKKWARDGAVLFMIVVMIVRFFSSWFLGMALNSASLTVIFFIFGILLFDKTRVPLSKEPNTAETQEPAIVPE